MTAQRPLVIAHRGASGYLPEHTLEAKVLAFCQGADYLEQDLVLSRDGVPLVLHDIRLDGVTDVAHRFPGRARLDGHWYAIDFDLDELQGLRVQERMDPATGHPVYPQRFPPPNHWDLSPFRLHTLDAELTLIRGLNRSSALPSGHQVGVYAELKEPAWHLAEGCDLTAAVLQVLARHGYDRPGERIFIQCFEPDTLAHLHGLLPQIPLIQLIGEPGWWPDPPTDFNALRTPAGLARVARYAVGIGPWLGHLFTESGADGRRRLTDLVAEAQAAGLLVHPYTLRRDDLPMGFESFDHLLQTLVTDLGVDGVFTDFPDLALSGLARLGLTASGEGQGRNTRG